MQHVVHGSLEHIRRIGETKRHQEELELAMMIAERRLCHIVQEHAYLVIPRTQVELGEEVCPMEFVEELVDD